MIRTLYGLTIRLYVLLIRLVSPFNSKASKWIEGRRNLTRKVTAELNNKEKTIWFHAASLGEFEQGRPLIEKIKQTQPNKKIILTFFSPSGYEIRKNYEPADVVSYLPIDTPAKVKAFIDAVNPEALFIIKYEFWYNLLAELKKREIKVFLISSIFRPDQHFFKWYGKWFLNNLKAITWFFVQDNYSKELLNRNGYSNVSISGDTRFDRVTEIAKKTTNLTLIEHFSDNFPVIVAGSTWPEDEAILNEAIQHFNSVKWIIAPHNVDDIYINRLLKNLPAHAKRLSMTKDTSNLSILVIDSIGLLNKIYRHGHISYVGGGFGKGIHNLLEAAVYGCPVIFGPNNSRFKEARDLINNNGGFEVIDKRSLIDTIKELLLNNEKHEQSSKAAKKYVSDHTGATSLILKKTGYYLSLYRSTS